MTPRRIQRRRTKGWRMPAGAVYVGRPTKWGNPWNVKNPRQPWVLRILDEYERHLDREIAAGRLDLEELRGRDLACWCREDSLCHADVLLRRANEGTPGAEP